MKSTELRIGNWVTEEKFGLWWKIDGIQEDSVLSSSKWRELNKFVPIPLTEEWLLKFGFKFRSERLCTIGYFEINILEGVYFVKSYYLRKIQYVHQLQNLYFALTGEELTIND